MTEDEQAELLGFTGKTIDGKLYVEFEDFDRLRKWVRQQLEMEERVHQLLKSQVEAYYKRQDEHLEREYQASRDFLESDMQGGQV